MHEGGGLQQHRLAGVAVHGAAALPPELAQLLGGGCRRLRWILLGLPVRVQQLRIRQAAGRAGHGEAALRLAVALRPGPLLLHHRGALAFAHPWRPTPILPRQARHLRALLLRALLACGALSSPAGVAPLLQRARRARLRLQLQRLQQHCQPARQACQVRQAAAQVQHLGEAVHKGEHVERRDGHPGSHPPWAAPSVRPLAGEDGQADAGVVEQAAQVVEQLGQRRQARAAQHQPALVGEGRLQVLLQVLQLGPLPAQQRHLQGVLAHAHVGEPARQGAAGRGARRPPA
jgi:hypothetical protein